VSQGARSAREYSSPACFLHELEPEVSGINTGVQIKRVYDAPAPSDGQRWLVDRLWPRGLRKEQAALDGWLKDVAPTPPLRKWFGHDPDRFKEFRKRYLAELKTRSSQIEALRERAKQGRLTLLYAARDPRINHALVLKEALEKGVAARRTVRSKRARKKTGPSMRAAR
jgi:uncharacterized protein YeaO (DUF488 family)